MGLQFCCTKKSTLIFYSTNSYIYVNCINFILKFDIRKTPTTQYQIPMKSLTLLFGLLLSAMLTTMAGEVEQVYHFGNPSVRHSGEYQRFELGNTMLTGLPGQPALPYRQVNLMLPPGEAAISVEIVFSDEVSIPGNFKLYPQQEVRPVSAGVSGTFIKDNAVYTRNAFLPADPRGKLLTAFLNGRSFALTSFSPVRYNPVTGTLSYYGTARIVIRTSPDAKALKALDNLAIRNPEALRLADNKDMDQAYAGKQMATANAYDYLIISTSAYKNSFGSLQANYLKEGLSSLVVTTDSITSTMPGQDVPEKIRNFIIQEYQTHGIQYVLLAGDDELIPHRGFYCYVTSGSGYMDQNIPADLYYSALDGNWNTNGDALWGEPGEDDLLPDIAVARMPFSTASELQHMLNKSFKYQFEPVPGEFRKVLMAGENLYSNPDTWGSDYLELLKGEHSDNGYTTRGIPVDYPFDYMYDETANWTGQDLMNHLNQGHPMLNHVGHANETYVMKLTNSDITNANFYGLNGFDHNFTIVYTHGCLCGAFDYNDCIAEKMVTIDNFAAAFVGNSRYGWFNEGQTEGPSAHLHREFMDALYSDSLNRIGRTHMESKIATASWVTAPGQWEPGALRWCFYDCNVLGDPALAIYSDNPISIEASYPATVLIGTPSLDVTVNSAGIPAAGLSCVAMKNGIVLGKSVTDATGLAIITFNGLVQDTGVAQLIVSGYNCTPATYGFTFASVAGPYVVYAKSQVNDPSGNQNNQPDFGETILLTNGMRNVGGTSASNVMVTLTSSDPYITITDSTELYATVAAGDTVTISNAFSFNVSGMIPNLHQVHFVLKAVSASTWLSDFNLTCYAPSLSVGMLAIDDASGGNGNGKLDPGETVTLNIPCVNNGNSSCSNAIATLTTSSPWISIVSAVFPVGTLSAGASANAQYVVQVSNNAPPATIVELEFLLSAQGYQASATFYPTIKLIVEDFESGNFNEFPWSKSGLNYWNITSDSPYEGLHCSRSAPIGDGRQSNMSITLDVLANDSISFYSKVTSEAIFDKLQFFIDIQPMEEWSGSIPWQRHSYAVSSGVHTFKWTYSKDMATSFGSDCAMVDFVVFPAFTDITGTGPLVQADPMLNISPNPAKDRIALDARLSTKCEFVVSIFAGDGKSAITSFRNTTGNDGKVHELIDISSLKPGFYTCEIKAGNIHLSRSFIVN